MEAANIEYYNTLFCTIQEQKLKIIYGACRTKSAQRPVSTRSRSLRTSGAYGRSSFSGLAKAFCLRYNEIDFIAREESQVKLICNGRIHNAIEREPFEADILIDGGKIVRIEKGIDCPEVEKIDASGLDVYPLSLIHI